MPFYYMDGLIHRDKNDSNLLSYSNYIFGVRDLLAVSSTSTPFALYYPGIRQSYIDDRYDTKKTFHEWLLACCPFYNDDDLRIRERKGSQAFYCLEISVFLSFHAAERDRSLWGCGGKLARLGMFGILCDP